jgi:hypothetical protein
MISVISIARLGHGAHRLASAGSGERPQSLRMHIHVSRLARAAIAWTLLCAVAPPVAFAPESPRFARAAEAYRALWAAEGDRMAAALEAETGLAFPAAPIHVVVYEGPSWAGLGGRPMRLRASYSQDEKRAALVHELGHRLIIGLPRDPAMDEHRTLFLFLYDAWTALYGQAFADRMVRIERRRRGIYDYDAAWTWALAMSRNERRARLRVLAGS